MSDLLIGTKFMAYYRNLDPTSPIDFKFGKIFGNNILI